MSILTNIVGVELIGSSQGFKNKFPTALSKMNLISSASTDEINKIVDKSIKNGIFDEDLASLPINEKKTVLAVKLNLEQERDGSDTPFIPNYGDFDNDEENEMPTGQSQFQGGEDDFNIQNFLNDEEQEGENEQDENGRTETEDDSEVENEENGNKSREREDESENKDDGSDSTDGEESEEENPFEINPSETKEDETEEEKKQREEKEKEDEENRENLNLIPLIIIPNSLKKNKDAKFSIKEKGISIEIKLKLDNKFYGVKDEFEYTITGVFKLGNTFSKEMNTLSNEYESFAKNYNKKILEKYKAK